MALTLAKNELSALNPPTSRKGSVSTVAALRASLSQSGALRRFAVSFPPAALPFSDELLMRSDLLTKYLHQNFPVNVSTGYHADGLAGPFLAGESAGNRNCSRTFCNDMVMLKH